MNLESRFSGKKILLFSPEFFGYGLEIVKKLRTLGAEVDYFDERPGNDFWTKALIRLNKSFLARKIDKYYRKIMAGLRESHYDYVVFLNAEAISEKNLKRLRKQQPGATFIIYMWDSIRNKKYTLDLLPCFDWKHTFDREDSLSNNEHGFNFRPLFFLDAYKQMISNKNLPVDLLFVGTVHSDRYPLLMRIREQCDALGLQTDFYMFFPSEKLYHIQKATNKAFSSAKKADFEFESLGTDALIEKIGKSKVILDIQHPSQKGLTMRTIEMIGARKKLMTTNREIMGYDFYDPKNIYCLDREDLRLDRSFFTQEYCDLDSEVYRKYSIDGWLEEVFSPSGGNLT